MFSSGPISWSNKNQKCVSLSTVEAEYVVLSGAAQEYLWLRQLEVKLGCPDSPTVIFEDNQSIIAMAKNPQRQHLSSFCSRTSSKWKY